MDPNFTFTSTFTAEADAFVRADSPTSNFGTDSELRMDASPQQESYVKFDVSGVGGLVTSATLRLFANNGTSNAPAVHTTATTDWTETDITWDTRPTADTTATANTGSVSAGTWVEYDVTGAVNGDGTLSFALLPESGDGMFTDSREAAQPPELVVEYK